jgi:protein-tyrosine phosphatase
LIETMWTWSLNWGEVTPSVIIGSCPMTPEDLERIRQDTAASAIFSLQHDACLAYWQIDFREMQTAGSKLDLTMARHPMRDFDIIDMRRQLPLAISTLAQLQAAGHRTYVHCTAGLGRAPLTVLGYLSLVQGFDPEQAIRRILAARPGAVPAWEAYHGCIQDLVERHRAAIERRAYGFYERGIHHHADADWCRAQAEVLRDELQRLQQL